MNEILGSRIAGNLEQFVHNRLLLSLLILQMLCSIRKVDIKSDVDCVTGLVYGLTNSWIIPIDLWKQVCIHLLTRKNDRWELADVDKMLRIARMDNHYALRHYVADQVLGKWAGVDPRVLALAKWGGVELRPVK